MHIKSSIKDFYKYLPCVFRNVNGIRLVYFNVVDLEELVEN